MSMGVLLVDLFHTLLELILGVTSAGGAAIAKSMYIPLVVTRDFSFDGLSLVCWAQAESTICIIAASIPHLRIFLCESPIMSIPTGSVRHITHAMPPNGIENKAQVVYGNQGCAQRPSK
ncbi:hypothetical protein BGZ60DRAFT_533824 [Tricladium varicosporioides]|nr:hypothetical protein BGZ60DRAFT_533824 [Hymenoscyphus varicosporioides]